MKRREGALVFVVLWVLGSALDAARAQSAQTIDKQLVANIPAVAPASLIGVQVAGSQAWVAAANGTILAFDLGSGAPVSPPAIASGLEPGVLDFGVRQGAPVFLTSAGTLAGQLDRSWPVGPFEACALEVAEDGALLLLGGSSALYFQPGATFPTKIPDLYPAIPLADGFLWAITRHPTFRTWQAELLDDLGNRMKRVCRFSNQFQPEGLRLGPPGPEGELLVSTFGEGGRWLSLVAPNGRMLWRLPAPDPICRRDLAWGPDGRLLVLELVDGQVCLRRWVFGNPEG
ncbi:MAG: hypothetical protein OZSIB_0902 [Candidatus Ozemobacter sibiricus]|jgi:hypothetical protein|uniref:WD40 repeat domain-containing protein n=1 Tax=Candidatus Ozemobacter sibiricus TaxID=2268124 RepID=A0A367ZUG1_9BACT|nr:MAG: hypothetical protein OZSIB_0902 [Candidatus Ozemobacter sibiricus]